ncbi:hypothetical protein [Alteribacillus sp. YIM 98480]|uniref:hypothetical protein n=1 Tax=Alteribacillus sp. YIM 98480 TaxID=2606599 RepID=UPI00131C4693|nr:hypothetical protein [Alteribacillus sp. YIM 98480]
MKVSLSILFSCFVVLVGCNSEQENQKVWVEPSTSSQATINSAIERLSEAEVDFKIDDNGRVMVSEKDMEKAVICCS